MNTINYDQKMRDAIAGLDGTPTLLLHSCCGPCSTYCLEELSPHFLVTVYYYNPNIDTAAEYEKRRAEQERFLAEHPWENPVSFVGEAWESDAFYEVAEGLENCPEGGARCEKCYELRLRKTAEYAKAHGFSYFTTTLTISPLKNAQKLNEIGQRVARETGVAFLPSDFKKRGGFLASTRISKAYGMYRQDYCGCVFSERNAKPE